MNKLYLFAIFVSNYFTGKQHAIHSASFDFNNFSFNYLRTLESCMEVIIYLFYIIDAMLVSMDGIRSLMIKYTMTHYTYIWEVYLCIDLSIPSPVFTVVHSGLTMRNNSFAQDYKPLVIRKAISTSTLHVLVWPPQICLGCI